MRSGPFTSGSKLRSCGRATIARGCPTPRPGLPPHPARLQVHRFSAEVAMHVPTRKGPSTSPWRRRPTSRPPEPAEAVRKLLQHARLPRLQARKRRTRPGRGRTCGVVLRDPPLWCRWPPASLPGLPPPCSSSPSSQLPSAWLSLSPSPSLSLRSAVWRPPRTVGPAAGAGTGQPGARGPPRP